jgi:hypothetical protein
MASKDRRPHETATVLDQKLLDFCQDNLDNKLQIIVEIERPQKEETRYNCTFAIGSPGIITANYHLFTPYQTVIFETSGTLPVGITPNLPYYVKNIVGDTFEISETIVGSSLDFSDIGSGAHKVSNAVGLIRISDRNIFVGSRFYEARTIVPLVQRTIGEWLRPVIEFSSLDIVLNNVDEKYSGMLPGSINYEGQINKSINIKLGLRDVSSTYFNIFSGFVSEYGGFKRDISSIKYIARDKFTKLDVKWPTETFSRFDYPKISENIIGTIKPVIYGDYTINVETEGNIPVTIVNSKDPQIFKEKEFPVAITNGTPGIVSLENHLFDTDDKIRFSTNDTLPSPLSDSTDYYVLVIDDNNFAVSTSPSGSAISTTGGSGQHNVIAQDLVNVRCVISNNELSYFNSDSVFLSRGDAFYLISWLDITNISADKTYFEVSQNSGNTIIDGENYVFEDGDVFLVKVKGEDLGAFQDNIVFQAQHILINYGNADPTEFDSNWILYYSKSTPSQSAIYNIKSRVWIQEQASVLEYVLSMLEQVRLELFISKDLKIKINPIHLDEFEPDPSHIIRNFDIIEGSLNVAIDEKNNFNRAQGFFDFNPQLGENNKKTSIYRNQPAIDQAGKAISKSIEFPNLYIREDVNNQLIEILRLSSGYSELIDCEMTSRQLLLDIGDFIKANITIGSTKYDGVPMMVREIGYSSDLKLPMKLWSFQMLPFANPGGWNPSYAGIVGGDLCTITEE